MSRLVGLLILILGFSLASYAEEKSPSSAQSTQTTPEKEISYLICKNKSDVRTLRIQKHKNGSCSTTYTKNGVDKIVSNTMETQRCANVLLNIRVNLEKASYKCKDISEARVSTSSE